MHIVKNLFVLTLKSMHSINPITLKLMYHHTSSYIIPKITIYTEINASNPSSQIGLENNIYTKINASNASNKIGLEISIYSKINASSANNKI